MPDYKIYGLNIRSDFKLTGGHTTPGSDEPQVTILREDFAHPDPAEFDEGRYSKASLHTAFLSWRSVGSIKIENGSVIRVSPLPDVPEDVVSLFITGAAMGVLLHQRGLLVLHASAVRIGDKAAAFIGFKGMGKSTTAASMVGRGHDLVSDDVVALDADYRIRPGSNLVKLWPSALEAALQDDPQTVPTLYPGIEKRAKLIEDTEPTAPSALGAIYVLDSGDELSIEPVATSEAFVEVMRHTYAPRFVGTAGTPPEMFSQCVRFVSAIPFYRLRRQPDLGKLSAVAAEVEKHFLELAAGHES